MAERGLQTDMTKARKLAEEWIHLGLGATAIPQPPFNGMEWFESYGERVKDDGNDARIVTSAKMEGSWPHWEMHPNGAEVVICISGSATFTQELEDGSQIRIALSSGEYLINPPGIWHTADCDDGAEVLFITAGMGTQHRER